MSEALTPTPSARCCGSDRFMGGSWGLEFPSRPADGTCMAMEYGRRKYVIPGGKKVPPESVSPHDSSQDACMLNCHTSNRHEPSHSSRLYQAPTVCSVRVCSSRIAPKQEKGVVCGARLSGLHAHVHGEMSPFNLATQASRLAPCVAPWCILSPIGMGECVSPPKGHIEFQWLIG